MKNPQRLIGKKVYGFKFDSDYDIYWLESMSSYVGKIGFIDFYDGEDNCFGVRFSNNSFFYPADQIEANLVEDEIPTFTKEEVLDLLYKRDLYLLNRDEDLELVLPEDWLNSIKTPTKEEQLTAILGSSEKVSEIMELFKN